MSWPAGGQPGLLPLSWQLVLPWLKQELFWETEWRWLKGKQLLYEPRVSTHHSEPDENQDSLVLLPIFYHAMTSTENKQADGFKTQGQAAQYRPDTLLAATHMGMPSTNHPFIITCRRDPRYSTIKSAGEGHLKWECISKGKTVSFTQAP